MNTCGSDFSREFFSGEPEAISAAKAAPTAKPEQAAELMRQIILDTETTGLEPAEGHRVIEIGCVELVDRRLSGNHFHQYLNPERDIEDGALEVHGISREFLQDKPVFADVVEEFLEFIDGAELIIHNAPFDIGFLDAELVAAGPPGPDG